MTLWERALDENRELRPHLRVAGELVEQMRGRGQRARLAVPAQYIERIQDPNTAPRGVYGSGLWINDSGDLSPAVFVQLGLAPLEGITASETEYAPILKFSDYPELARDILFVGLPPPQSQNLVANTIALIGSLRGRLGLPIWCPNGSYGYTTAGHNALSTPVVVWDEHGQRIGNIDLSFHLNNMPAMAPTADVAVIELDRPDPHNDGAFRIGTCQPFDVVRLQGGAGSMVRGLSPDFAWLPSTASWGEVAITSDMISVAGDSGGVVVRDDGLVVGHVVAGYHPAYTLIQDANYMLAAVGASLR